MMTALLITLVAILMCHLALKHYKDHSLRRQPVALRVKPLPPGTRRKRHR